MSTNTTSQINTIVGSHQADHLKGSHKNDVIYGQGGGDKIEGKDGHDVIYGDRYAPLPHGHVRPAVVFPPFNDKLYGGDGNDKLYGEWGNDELYGGHGKDKLYGGSGNDYLSGGFGNDYFDGGEGIDTVTYDYNKTGIKADLHAGQVTFKSGPSETLISIENLIGSQAHDTLKGNHLGNQLEGRKGDDKLYGKGGNDALYGGKGKDYLEGGDGYDFLNGGEGDDKLYGNDGKDTLIGGKGHDKLVGGHGKDRLNGFGTHADHGTQYDKLYGNGGSDVFVLGGHWGVSYFEKKDGYAKIMDWDPQQGAHDREYDTIEVFDAYHHGAGHAPSHAPKGHDDYYKGYSLKFTHSQGIGSSHQKDTEIYFTNEHGKTDRIGIIADSTDVSLRQDFRFV